MRAIVPTIVNSVAARALTACATANDVVIETAGRPTMDVSAFSGSSRGLRVFLK